MERKELLEYINEFRDANSEQQLIRLLKDKLVEELESWDATTDHQKHDLNMMIRDLEEELDFIESKKLAEFDPEQQ